MNDNIFPPEEWKPSHVTGVKELIEEGTKFRAEIEKRSKRMFQESCAMCDQLRAENEKLKKEAHDKHWPLANACRNLLPHSDEDNIAQVWAASRELKQLRAEIEKFQQAINRQSSRCGALKAEVERLRDLNKNLRKKVNDFQRGLDLEWLEGP